VPIGRWRIARFGYISMLTKKECAEGSSGAQ
jgi:hypothetical protein